MNYSKILIICILIFGAGIFHAQRNSKEKFDYTKTEGIIQHYEKTYKNLPNRHHGDYRYLILDSYPYVFEIYEPNHKPIEHHIDELIAGDKIEVYYYEIDDTHASGINRFAQFIDKESIPYYVQNGFQKKGGYFVSALAVLVAIGAFFLKKKGKI